MHPDIASVSVLRCIVHKLCDTFFLLNSVIEFFLQCFDKTLFDEEELILTERTEKNYQRMIQPALYIRFGARWSVSKVAETIH